MNYKKKKKTKQESREFLLTCCIQCNLVIVFVLQKIFCIVQTATFKPFWDICNAFGRINHLKKKRNTLMQKTSIISTDIC